MNTSDTLWQWLLFLFLIPTWCPCRTTVPGWSGCCACDADTWWMKDESGELKQFKVWYCSNYYPVCILLYLFQLRPSSPHLLLLPKVGCPPPLPEWGEHRGGGHGEDKGLPRMPRRPRSERKSEEHHNCWTSAVEEDKERYMSLNQRGRGTCVTCVCVWYLCPWAAGWWGGVVCARDRQVVAAALPPQTLDVKWRLPTWQMTRRQTQSTDVVLRDGSGVCDSG